MKNTWKYLTIVALMIGASGCASSQRLLKREGGLLGRRKVAEHSLNRPHLDPEKRQFLKAAISSIDAVLGFEALPAVIDQADQGNRRLANQCCEVGDVVISLFRHDIH